jgi:hypothetical protein
MKRATIVGGAFAIVLGLAIAAYLALKQNVAPATPTSTASTPSTVVAEAHPSFLYGRITLTDGTTYEGRLRLGGDQEAFWGDYFNGFKNQNPWAAYVGPPMCRPSGCAKSRARSRSSASQSRDGRSRLTS